MDFAMLADLEKLIVPIVVVIIYVVANLVKYVGEQKAPPRRPAAPPPLRVPPRVESSGVDQVGDRMQMESSPSARVPQRQGSEPRVELDRFLEELGVRKPKGPSRPPTPPKPNRRERGRGKSQPPSSLPARSERASARHLTSQLEQRHTDDVRSEIESQHLQSQVHLVESNIGSSADGPSRAIPAGDAVLLNLIRNRDTLARAMVLGMVLGPPHSLRDDNRLV